MDQRQAVQVEAGVPTLATWIRFLRRNWILIAGCSLGAATLVAVLLTFVLAPDFEASATIVVVQPKFSSSLKPDPISVQGYQRLLESDAVLGETVDRLVAEGVLSEGRVVDVREMLTSRIFVARREEQTALAPVIELVARAETGAAASAIANTWAEVFLDRSDELFGRFVDRTATLVEDQYSTKQAEVEELEREISSTEDDFQGRIDEVTRRWDERLHEIQTRWDRDLVDHRKSTEELVSAHQLETRELIESFASERGLELRAPGDDGSRSVSRRAEGAEEADSRLSRVVTLRIQLAQTPEFVSIERSMSDDALWQAMALGEADMLEVEPLLERTLLSREPNLLHGDLALRVADAETGLDALHLSPERREEARAITGGVERLQRQRSAGLSSLLVERAASYEEMKRAELLELGDTRRQRRRELDALRRQRDRRLGELGRRLDHRVAQFEELAENYEEALLARAEGNQLHVRLGSPAVPPLGRQPGYLLLGSVVGLLFGALIGLLIGIFREVDGP